MITFVNNLDEFMCPFRIIMKIVGGVIMIQNLGIPGLILILTIALIIFGPSTLPEIGKAFGSTLREFKNSTKDLLSEDNNDARIQENEESLTDK